MDGIWAQIITKEMAVLAAGAVALMLGIGRIPFKGGKLNETQFWKDWGSFLLTLICMAGSFAPGVNKIPLSEWGGIVIFGAVAALAAHLGRKALAPIFMRKLEGKDPIQKE